MSLKKEENILKENKSNKNENPNDNNIKSENLDFADDVILDNNAFNQSISSSDAKIIIKNTSTGDEKFFNLLPKIVIVFLKVMLIPLIIILAFTLVGLIISLVGSFLILKSKLHFVGVFLSLWVLIILNIIVLIFLLNLIFNRESKIKLMINSFLASLILLGLGLGFSLVSLVGFSESLTMANYWQTFNIDIPIQDNLFISTPNNEEINFMKIDSDNVRIEYRINAACHVDDKICLNGGLYLSSSCTNKSMILKEIIASLNNNDIYNFSDNIHNIKNVTVYANNKSLSTIKDKMKN